MSAREWLGKAFRGLAAGVACIVAVFSASLSFADINMDDWVVTRYAGGVAGFQYYLENVPATQVTLNPITDIAFDSKDNMYFTEGQQIRRVDKETGIITTYVGKFSLETPDIPQNNVPAREVSLVSPFGIAFDKDDNLYVTTHQAYILKVDAAPPHISRIIAGIGWSLGPATGDGGLALEAKLSGTLGIAVAPDGSVYFHDIRSIRRLYKVTPDSDEWYIESVAGSGDIGFPYQSGMLAIDSSFHSLNHFLRGPVFDSKGNFYSGHINEFSCVSRINAFNKVIIRYAGSGSPSSYGSGFSGDGGPAVNAKLQFPSDLAVDAEDDLYIADKWNHRIRRVDSKTQVINTVMGRYLVENYLPTGQYYDGYIPDGTKVRDAELSYPTALAFDSKGNMYVAISDSEYESYGPNPGKKIIKVSNPNPIPACPTDLTVDYSYTDGKHTAMLTWNAPANTTGITGYHIYRDGVLAINIPHVNGITQYSKLSILANCREYSFKVTSFNAQGTESPDCAEVRIKTSDVYRPVRPTGLTATAISGSEVELNWLPTTDTCDPESALMYNVYRDGVYIGETSDTTYTDQGLADCPWVFTYRVSASDTSRNESWRSDPATVDMPDVTPPSIPLNLTATGVDETTIELKWDESSDNCDSPEEIACNVYRDGVYLATVTGTGYTDTGLTCNTVYTYVVNAQDTSGNVSGVSAPATAATRDLTKPTVPQNLAAGAVSGSAISLTWDASSDNCDGTAALSYNIYRDGNFLIKVTGTSHTDTGLEDCTTYAYVVSAEDTTGNVSAVSAPPATARTLDTTAPAVPRGLAAAYIDGTSILLGWLPSSDECEGTAAGYNVYAADGTPVGTTTSTTFTVAGLNECTEYCYYVKAFDTSNNVSDPSGPACAKTPAVIGWDGGAGGKCGGTYNVSSAVTVEFTLTRGGSVITDADIAGLTPRLYYKTAGGLVPVDPNVIGSKLEMFKYTNNGTWKVIIHTCAPSQPNCDGMALVPGEYVIVAELGVSGNALCEYVVFGSQPTCGFTLTESGNGGGNGNGGGKK